MKYSSLASAHSLQTTIACRCCKSVVFLFTQTSLHRHRSSKNTLKRPISVTLIFLKPRLAMVMRFFLEIVASLAHGGGYASERVCDFVAESSTHSISRDFLAVVIAALARGWLHV